MQDTLVEVNPSTDLYQALVATAELLNQAQYVPLRPAHMDEALVLGQFRGHQCLGFFWSVLFR